jgi:hypothetical protein
VPIVNDPAGITIISGQPSAQSLKHVPTPALLSDANVPPSHVSDPGAEGATRLPASAIAGETGIAAVVKPISAITNMRARCIDNSLVRTVEFAITDPTFR